jgi:hypothetical protein
MAKYGRRHETDPQASSSHIGISVARHEEAILIVDSLTSIAVPFNCYKFHTDAIIIPVHDPKMMPEPLAM